MFSLVINKYVFQPKQKGKVSIRAEFNSERLVGDTNMAAVSLFRDTNMAAVTPRENTQYVKLSEKYKITNI